MSRPTFGFAVAALLGSTAVVAAQSFWNWESPHVNPLDLTPDGTRLLAVNTADNRLEVFDVAVNGALTHAASIFVGLEPVSVRARTDTEVWVVNHVSDSACIVDLKTMSVIATLNCGDEPADVIFAGSPQGAFVSVSQLNEVRVFDPANLASAPLVLPIQGEDPRAMATDGLNVYVAIFESGNRTTILDFDTVAGPLNPYAGDPNPPPNNGTGFSPPIAAGLPNPPDVSQIVRKGDDGTWRDDNNANWSAAVTWDLHDHDMAIINVSSLAVSYATGIMNANMSLAVSPAGDVLVVGTDGTNEVRFEPNVAGTFVRVMGGVMSGGAAGPPALLADLNPHLDYTTATLPQAIRDLSIGDPRGVAWSADGSTAWITGMGSNNVVAVSASLARLDQVDVGQGPTGIRLHEPSGRLFVLNRFDATISMLDSKSLSELSQTSFYDPTPAAIRDGRPHLYDTHETSGLGQASCASCHIDGRMDQLAWDLGNPQGQVKPFNQVCNFGFGGCENWHPMKGPMTTQTLIGIIGTGPLHWRADREDLAAFNPAFEGLMGDDEQLTALEMNQYTAFVATLRHPPNPNRNLNNTLRTALPNGGNAVTGQSLFMNTPLDGGAVTCVTCHALPAGTNGQLTSGPLLQEPQSMKIPQLRNLYEKTGFSIQSASNNRGFGFTHDGAIATIFEFLQFPGFTFAGGAAGNQQRRDVEAFMLSFSTDTHAGVGAQATIGGVGADQTALRNQIVTIAQSGVVGLVVKGAQNGQPRGYYLNGASYQSDRAGEVYTLAQLDAAAGAGEPHTYTLVPAGTQVRIGVDRDGDGAFDRDEIDACSDPADPQSVPRPNGCAGVPGDANGDGIVDVLDMVAVVLGWGACPQPPAGCPADVTGDGMVDVLDLVEVVLNWT